MGPYEHFTREIAAGMRGKAIGAFFDFDGTVIATHSIRDLFLERLRNGAVDVGDVLRSLLVRGAARPIRAFGAPESEATNLSLGNWTDVADAIARLKLLVDGEQHLWSDRPAVFVFNHQSAVDVLITARLLREDVIGVAKKEIKHQLPMGIALTYTGTVFIGREHVGDTRIALKPAVDALRSGRSVVIAPEGTRSRDGTPGPFKLGAFHMARQAGVPIVPIVIHNAQDALPYKAVVVRPAEVKVTVLPPQRTDDWEIADVELQAARIRAMYVDELGQPERREPAASAGG